MSIAQVHPSSRENEPVNLFMEPILANVGQNKMQKAFKCSLDYGGNNVKHKVYLTCQSYNTWFFP